MSSFNQSIKVIRNDGANEGPWGDSHFKVMVNVSRSVHVVIETCWFRWNSSDDWKNKIRFIASELMVLYNKWYKKDIIELLGAWESSWIRILPNTCSIILWGNLSEKNSNTFHTMGVFWDKEIALERVLEDLETKIRNVLPGSEVVTMHKEDDLSPYKATGKIYLSGDLLKYKKN